MISGWCRGKREGLLAAELPATAELSARVSQGDGPRALPVTAADAVAVRVLNGEGVRVLYEASRLREGGGSLSVGSSTHNSHSCRILEVPRGLSRVIV